MEQKILLVITQGYWGGAQKYVDDLAGELQAKNYEVAVAVGEPNGDKDLQGRLLTQGIKVFQLQHLVRPIALFDDCAAIFELANLYKEYQPAIVHLNSSKAGFLGSLAKFFVKNRQQLKIIYTVHGWVFLEPVSALVKMVYFWMEKISASWKDKIIVLSNRELKIAQEKLGIAKNKLVKISHGLKLKSKLFSRAEARAVLNLPDGKILGTVAGFYRNKGLDILLQAMKSLSPEIKLVLIGDGPEKEKLQKLVATFALEHRVFFPGRLMDVYRYLMALDVFVLPSRKEGFPYALLEAGAVGLPVVATDVGGVGEIIEDERTGLLVSPELVDKLTAEIEQLFLNNEQAQKMGLALKEKIRTERNYEDMIEKTIEVYQG